MRLRPLSPGDLDALVALDADPDVMRHITGGPPTPRALYLDVLLPRMLAAGGGDPERGFFVAEDTDGDFLGWFHLRPDGWEPAWLELGYRLCRERWGQGLATEGTLALMAHARRRDPDTVFSARTVPENAASRRVMAKCGLVEQPERFTFPAREWPGLSLPEWEGVLYRTT
ncbi:MAG: GNAT family N-acetyltransferase [Alphaproteobacteria bacterium]|nr:GNAT family N-acetyltransferase [Alphaproteobacteria bacterium]